MGPRLAWLTLSTFDCEQSGLFELNGEEGDPEVLLGQLDVEALVVARLRETLSDTETQLPTVTF